MNSHLIENDRNFVQMHKCDQQENVLPNESQACYELNARQCNFRRDCYSIEGQQCGSIIGQTSFIECVPNYKATKGLL